MTTEPLHESSPRFTLAEAALRLDLPESTIREWLSTFNWERHYDGAGHLYLAPRDLEFLRVIKSLKEVDRSCESIVRVIHADAPLEVQVEEGEQPELVEEAEEPEAIAEPEPVEQNLEQIETLKAELKELHAKPAKKPFWKFWG